MDRGAAAATKVDRNLAVAHPRVEAFEVVDIRAVVLVARGLAAIEVDRG